MQEQSKISVRVDQTLIKQFARRIYANMKEYLQTDREQSEKLINAIFAIVQTET